MSDESILVDDDRDVALTNNDAINDLEEQLFVLMQKKVADGMSPTEVMFTFARCAYRMITPEGPPPAGQTYYMKVTGRNSCGCLLAIEVGDCTQPDDFETGGCHEPAN